MKDIHHIGSKRSLMYARSKKNPAKRQSLRVLLGSAVLAALTACASTGTVGTVRQATVWAITQDAQLVRFHASQPQRILERKAVTGMSPEERLVGMDYRVARGVLYVVSSTGRVYTLETASGALRAVSEAPVALAGQAFGMDFNPVADRIRLVSNTGTNLRLHPDTGSLVDFDPQQTGVQPDSPLRYAPGDVHAGQAPEIVAAAYTYNKKDDTLTTNYAIDRATGVLVTQGSPEGSEPVVSPNSGLLYTVGALGLGPLRDVAFDIADVDNTAFAAITSDKVPRTMLYQIDLRSGQARRVGQVGDGSPLVGMAIEP